MLLGIVCGQVVSTVRAPGMPPLTWLLVEFLDKGMRPTGVTEVAADPLGSGEGELVVMVRGSSARRAFADNPVDLTIIGIVDGISSQRREIYRKDGGLPPVGKDAPQAE